MSGLTIPPHSQKWNGCTNILKRRLVNNLRYKQPVATKKISEHSQRLVCHEWKLYSNKSPVIRWVHRNKSWQNEQTELRDLSSSEHSATVTSLDLLNHAEAIIGKDRQISSRQQALQLSVNRESAIEIFKTIVVSMVFTRWIPQNL